MAGNSFAHSYSSLHNSDLFFSFDFEGTNIDTNWTLQDNTLANVNLSGNIQFDYPLGFSFFRFFAAFVTASLLVFFVWSQPSVDQSISYKVVPTVETSSIISDIPESKLKNQKFAAAVPEVKEKQILDTKELVSEDENPVSEEPEIAEHEIISTPQSINDDVKENAVPLTDKPLENSLASAIKRSAKTGRFVFLKFGAEWCIPCKMMEEGAFMDHQVKSVLNEKFIVVDIDIDRPENTITRIDYAVSKLPTIIILDQYGNEVRREERSLNISGMRALLSELSDMIILEERALTQTNNNQYPTE